MSDSRASQPFATNTKAKAVHESDRIRFGVDPHPIQLNRVNEIWTHGQPKVRVKPSGMSYRLNRLEPLDDFG